MFHSLECNRHRLRMGREIVDPICPPGSASFRAAKMDWTTNP